VTATRIELAGLTARIVGPPDAALTCVLLHGFGAPGDDLVSLADEIASSDAPVRFVFPAAPLELGGLYGDSRAWWLLDLARLEEDLRRGTPRDRRDEVPDGLPAARDHVVRFLDQLTAHFTIAGDRLVLGGFSQGAMLSLDVALAGAPRLDGVVAMSGLLLVDSVPALTAPRATRPRFLLSNGRYDQTVPFAGGNRAREMLEAHAFSVTWRPFEGGHEIPAPLLAEMDRFLFSPA
jgi:phospholipase/carboxylesterase